MASDLILSAGDETIGTDLCMSGGCTRCVGLSSDAPWRYPHVSNLLTTDDVKVI